MIKKKQNGFTLILSLVLLLVMSLMGGSLIVIASSDHQSNNTSDQYQQTFYVAEHALMEAEKHLINRILGPWVKYEDLVKCGDGDECNMSNYEATVPDDISDDEKAKAEAENAKVSVRNVRREGNTQLKEFLKEKEISEDEERQGEEEIQKLTDLFVGKVEAALEAKEKDLLDF